jgi:hypothetical protein
MWIAIAFAIAAALLGAAHLVGRALGGLSDDLDRLETIRNSPFPEDQ